MMLVSGNRNSKMGGWARRDPLRRSLRYAAVEVKGQRPDIRSGLQIREGQVSALCA